MIVKKANEIRATCSEDGGEGMFGEPERNKEVKEGGI